MKTTDHKIDPRQLTGEALYVYFTEGSRDAEYASLVELLLYATCSMERTCEILERSVKEERKLKAIYPPDNGDISGFEYIGDIIDGALYLA
jgi:hypothetical protein